MTANINTHYNVIGLMSGTSMDGVDIAFCRFSLNKKKWGYTIVKAETVKYPSKWKKLLINLQHSDALHFLKTHNDYGFYLGKLIIDFIKKNKLTKIDFVASHGHTIFHQPDKKLTVQIGAGNAIAAACNLPVICDFRTTDVSLGGQGAPLVPIGDQLLFSEFDFCLNLGGFANVSYQHENKRIAYDICPVNIVMNEVCHKLHKEFDNGGAMARNGEVNDDLLKQLNKLSFYKQALNTPKSLGKEWVVKNIDPLLEKHALSEITILRTFCEHIAIQISQSLSHKTKGKLLITGGGAYNTFLLELIQKKTEHQLVVPENKTVEFKEALIFAFLGVLRFRNEVNCLKSVTGAVHNNSGGAIYSC